MEPGAAIGLGFTVLKMLVMKTHDNVFLFKSELADLDKTLTAICPGIEQLEQLNIALGHPKEELKELIEIMEQGTELVKESSNIFILNFFKMYNQAKDLRKLIATLDCFYKYQMPTLIARDVKNILCTLRTIDEKVTMIGSCISISASASDPKGSGSGSGYVIKLTLVEAPDDRVIEEDMINSHSSLKAIQSSVADKEKRENNHGKLPAIDAGDQEIEVIKSPALTKEHSSPETAVSGLGVVDPSSLVVGASTFGQSISSADAALLRQFAAANPEFLLPTTMRSEIYREVAYQAFIKVYHFLTSHTLRELLHDRKDEVLSKLNSLVKYGFRGHWLDHLMQMFQQAVPSFTEIPSLCADRAARRRSLRDLEARISLLSGDELSAARDAVASQSSELASVEERIKLVEDLERILDKPFTM